MEGTPWSISVMLRIKTAYRLLLFSDRYTPIIRPAGTAINEATVTIRRVPVIPLAIPPGIIWLPAMAAIAWSESGAGWVKKLRFTCLTPFKMICPIISIIGIIVSTDKAITKPRNIVFFLDLDTFSIDSLFVILLQIFLLYTCQLH